MKIKAVIILLLLIFSPFILRAAPITTWDNINDSRSIKTAMEKEHDIWYKKGYEEGKYDLKSELTTKPLKINSIVIFLYIMIYYIIILLPLGIALFFSFGGKKLSTKIISSIVFAILFIILLFIIHSQNRVIYYL